MPCNLPLVNVSASLLSKIRFTDRDALMQALYDIEQTGRVFTFSVTPEGHIKINSAEGDVTLQWVNGEYTISGANQSRARLVLAPVFSTYQATVLQNTMIEKGFMTEKVPGEKNFVTVNAWRS